MRLKIASASGNAISTFGFDVPWFLRLQHQDGKTMGNAPSDDSSEMEMMARLQRGDAKALEQLYDRYERPLYSLALKMLSNPSEAEEAVQDVFTSLWKKSSTFDSKRARLFTWLTSLMRNRCIDRLRYQQRRIPSTDREPVFEAQVDRTALDDLFDQERANHVRRAVSRLPREQGEVIRLAFFGGLTYTEVAHHLNIPLGTAKSRIRYAMRRLRDELEEKETP